MTYQEAPKGGSTHTTREFRADLVRYSHGHLLETLGPDYLLQTLQAARTIFHADDVPPLHFPMRRHGNSEAHYLIDRFLFEENGRLDVGYAYILSPKAKTSEHFHPFDVHEDYYQILGETFIDGIWLTPGKQHRVPSGKFHQAHAADSWSLTVVVTRNGGKYKPEDLHIPKSR